MTIKKRIFSFSAVSTFENCPRAFKYKYIDYLPEAFTSIEAYMGSCIHSTLEWAYIQRQEGYIPSIEQALEQYKYLWDNGDFNKIKIIKQDQSKADYYIKGGEFITSFFQRVFPLDKSTTVYLEHQFDFPLEEEIILRGVIDRISKDTDGVLRVIDYKTGQANHPLDTLQLPSYALYIFQHNIDMKIRLCLEDLRQNKTVTVLYTRKDAKGVRTELLGKIRKIIETSIEDFITKPSILCLWCGYNQICDNPHPSVKESSISKIEPVITPHIESEKRSVDYLEACPLCGGELQERRGKFGTFIGCENFPNCRYTCDINSRGDLATNPQIDGKDICPECGSLLRQRTGKYGDFIGCSNYPECRFTRPV